MAYVQSRETEIADAINAAMIAEMERRAVANGYASLDDWYDEGDYQDDTNEVINSGTDGYTFEHLGGDGAVALYRVTVHATGERVLLNCWNGDGGQGSDTIGDGGLGFDNNIEMHEEKAYYPRGE